MIIHKEIIINKSINETWQILGEQFTDIHKWASSVSHSEGYGKAFNGATCSERGCSTTMGGLKEKLTNFSKETHSLSYLIYAGLPGMIKSAENSWKLTAPSAQKTKLVMKMNIQIGGIMGAIMKPMMKMQMSKMARELVEEFKYYVEIGKAHPRKIKAMKKASA